MRRAAATAAATALSVALAGPAAAQEPGPPGAGARREEAFKMIDAYIVSNLQESLGLSDEQFVKLLPLVRKQRAERRAFAQRRMATLQRMRLLLNSGVATEGGVAELLRELRTIDLEEPQAARKNLEAVEALLAPIQQAKYRVLEVEVERRIIDLMGRRQSRGGQRPQPPPR